MVIATGSPSSMSAEDGMFGLKLERSSNVLASARLTKKLQLTMLNQQQQHQNMQTYLNVSVCKYMYMPKYKHIYIVHTHIHTYLCMYVCMYGRM